VIRGARGGDRGLHVNGALVWSGIYGPRQCAGFGRARVGKRAGYPVGIEMTSWKQPFLFWERLVFRQGAPR
jgi:hypothetical protein